MTLLAQGVPSGGPYGGKLNLCTSNQYEFGCWGIDNNQNFFNANGPVIPNTALGFQGPAAGYVQLAPSSIGTPGCLYDNGSGIRSWAACSVGLGYTGTTAATSCGSLSGAAGCLTVPIAGVTHYVPYF